MKRKLGLRSLLNVIPLDATLVKGSHGRIPSDERDAPVLMTGEPSLTPLHTIAAADVHDLILEHVGV